MLKKNNKIELHYIIPVFCLVFLLVIGSCANGSQTSSGNDIITNIDTQPVPENSNSTSPDLSGNKIKSSSVFGLVMTNGNDIHIIQNWLSKSKVSFKVNGKFKSDILKQDGNLVAVNGLVEKTQKWSGKIDVLGIERVWEDGKTIDVEGMIVIKKGQPFIREAQSSYFKKEIEYEITGEMKDSVMSYKGKSIRVQGILNQKKDWMILSLNVLEII